MSAFYVDCPEKGISAKGFDQISAKFTGTSVKVTPGEHNLGIFITLEKRDNEEYQLTHPAAHLGGLLRGGLNVTVGDVCYVTCPKTRIKTILHYQEEGWLGKTQNRMDGVIFRYDPDNDEYTKLRDVPTKDVLARVFGNWKDKLYFSLGAKSVSLALREIYFGSDSNLCSGCSDTSDRSESTFSCTETPSSGSGAIAKRIVEILVRRHKCHRVTPVLTRHDFEARARRTTAAKGKGKRSQRYRMEAKILCRRNRQRW